MIWVVGAARTGTSMLMRRLDLGGLPAAHEPRDGQRNPHGNYELPGLSADPASALAGLPRLCAVKVFGWWVPAALEAGHVPDAVLITHRARTESDASLLAGGHLTGEDLADGARWSALDRGLTLLAERQVPTLTVDFHHTIDHPYADAQRIAGFLAPWVALDVDAMAAVPDPAHRHYGP